MQTENAMSKRIRAAIHVAGQPSPDAVPSRYVPSVDRAKQLLGLEETVNLQESIRRTAAWYGNLPEVDDEAH